EGLPTYHQKAYRIRDCSTARAWCARSFNYLDNAKNAFSAPIINLQTATELPAIAPDNIKYPGMNWPRYHITDGVRYLHTSPYGSLHTNNQNPDDPFNGEFLESKIGRASCRERGRVQQRSGHAHKEKSQI